MILPDNETNIDLLNYNLIAQSICKLIKSGTEPLTVGVHGDWGAGKSSILLMIKDLLKEKDNYLCIKFNSWRYQGFEDAKIALMNDIITQISKNVPKLKKLTKKIKETVKKLNFKKIAVNSAGYMLNIATGISLSDKLESLGSSDETKDEMDDDEDTIDQFQNQFNELIESSNYSRIVVLVDDLDRCLPKTVVETLEAIKLFLFSKKTMFVIACDEVMIEYSVKDYFPERVMTDLQENEYINEDFSRKYLEKLIQIPFRIPLLGDSETKMFILLLMLSKEFSTENEEFIKLKNEVLNLFKTPWIDIRKELQIIKRNYIDALDDIDSMIGFSLQIGTALARGYRGNPRQIKRFMNSLILRSDLVELMGFSGEFNNEILAKIMIAEQFYPELFEELSNYSTNSDDGICKPLNNFENFLKMEGNKTSTFSGEFPENWMTNPEISSWVLMKPSLFDVDLRAYFFATRDRKNIYKNSQIPEKLNQILKSLLGTKLQINHIKQKLEDCNPYETEMMFNEIKQNIFQENIWGTQPNGVEGLIELCKVNENLFSLLIKFFEDLPIDGLGLWAPKLLFTGRSMAKGSLKSKFDKILREWMEQNVNQPLSISVKSQFES